MLFAFSITSIFAWIILGIIAGALARFLMPGKDPMSWLMTMVLGIAGAIVGGFIGNLIGFLPAANPEGLLPGLGSIITGTVGAFLLLLVFRLVKKNS